MSQSAIRRGIVSSCIDQLLPSRFIWSVCDLWVPRGKELLLLNLHPLPRRIPQDHIEPAVHEHVWKRQVPVEETVLGREVAGRLHCQGGRLALAVADLPPEIIGGRGCPCRGVA